MAQIVETVEQITTESAAMRGAIIGTFIGFVVVGGIAFAMSIYGGASTMGAVGIAAFAGFWGGPGFGGMLGGTLAAVRNDARGQEHAAPTD